MNNLDLSSLLKPYANKAMAWAARWQGREIPFTAQRVIEALWDNPNRRPLIHREIKTAHGWDLVIVLPVDISKKDFLGKLDYFRDATGIPTLDYSNSGKGLLLRFTGQELEQLYPYDWDYDRTGGMYVVPIGYDHTGLHTFALERAPHILVGGGTGNGKSSILDVWINSLLEAPLRPMVFVIDLKKSEFAYLKNHVALVTDAQVAEKVLEALHKEMKRRQQLFFDTVCRDYKKFNKKYPDDALPYIVVVVDEIGQLKRKRALEILADLLSLSRGAGFSFILATQRPSSSFLAEKSFGDLKCHLLGRLAVGCADKINSRIILESEKAGELPDIPGRALWKFGNKIIEVQTPFLDPDSPELLQRLAIVPPMKRVMVDVPKIAQ